MDANGILNDNRLYYQRGDRLEAAELPPLHPALEVRRVPQGHPAYPGHGLYVADGQRIDKDERLGYYAGIYRLEAIADTTPCCFGLADSPYCVDAQYRGNALRYANDPRGIMRFANVRSEEAWVSCGARHLLTVFFYTVCAVEANTELTIHYGAHYDMAMRPQPWREDLPSDPAAAPGILAGSDSDGDSSSSSSDDDDDYNGYETKHMRCKRVRADLDECCDMLKRTAGRCFALADVRYTKEAVQRLCLESLGRKLFHRGHLSVEERQEADDLCAVVRPWETHLVCKGPCGRRRKARHFGQPTCGGVTGYTWPWCNTCIGKPWAKRLCATADARFQLNV